MAVARCADHDRGVSVRGYVEATHAGPTAAVTTFTVALALAVGLGWRTVPAGAAVLAGQLSIGWGNDYLDRHGSTAARDAEKPVVSRRRQRARARRRRWRWPWCSPCRCRCCSARSPALRSRGGRVRLGVQPGLKRTSASPLPYLVAFALVPTSFVVLALPGQSWPRPTVVLASGLLGVSAHFTNAVKDLEADALTGVRGMPQRLGARWSGAASAACC